MIEYKPKPERIFGPDDIPKDEEPKVPYGVEGSSVSKRLKKIIKKHRRKIIIGFFLSLWIFCGILFGREESSISPSRLKMALFYAIMGVSLFLFICSIVFAKKK